MCKIFIFLIWASFAFQKKNQYRGLVLWIHVLREASQVAYALVKHDFGLMCPSCTFDVVLDFVSNALKANYACTNFPCDF